MTAHVDTGDGRLRINRTGLGRWFGSPVDVPLAHVVSVTAADAGDVRGRHKGIRLAGIQLPGLMTLGIYRHDGQVTWWDVRRGTTAVVITLRDEKLTTVIVEVDDPVAVIRELEQALADAAFPTS